MITDYHAKHYAYEPGQQGPAGAETVGRALFSLRSPISKKVFHTEDQIPKKRDKMIDALSNRLKQNKQGEHFVHHPLESSMISRTGKRSFNAHYRTLTQ